VRAYNRWKENKKYLKNDRFIFEVKKYDDYLEIISSDLEENGRRIELN